MSKIVCALTILAAAILGGCAAQQVALHAGASLGRLSGTYDGPITQAVTMPGVGIFESVPSAADIRAAVVTPETAFSECSEAGSTCLRDPGITATETLARVTSTVDIPDQLQNRLVYVIRWDGFKCSSHGPRAVEVASCTQLTFIDARTGEDLGASISGTSAFDPNAVIEPPIRNGTGKPTPPSAP